MNTTIKSSSPFFVKHSDTYSSQTVIKLVAPLLILTAGTGGVFTVHSTAEATNRWIYYPRIHVEPSVAKQVDTRSPAEHIANIRDVLAINMSDLASVLRVTRPTVYAWLEGQEPKAEAVIHIQQLSRTADEINRESIVRLDKLVHRPILNGRSLLDILKAGEDPLEALPTLKKIAKKEAQTRHEQKGAGKLRPLNDILGEFPVAMNDRS